MKWVFAVLLPPLGVALAGGGCGDIVINIVLSCLGGLPGMLHAFYVCARSEK